MNLDQALLLALGLCVGLLLLLHDRRLALALLFGVALSMVALMWSRLLQAVGPAFQAEANTLAAIEGTTAVTVILILLVTSLTSPAPKGHPPPLTGEGSHSPPSLGGKGAGGLGQWAGGLGLVILVVLATLLLPRWYGVPPRAVDYAWTLLLAGGVALLCISHTLLGVGIGLMVLLFGLKLLYVALMPRLAIVDVGLVNLTTILAALIAAYLHSLLPAHLEAHEDEIYIVPELPVRISDHGETEDHP